MESFPSELYRDRVDLVAAGFPCQGASVAGKRRGVDDERWLWPVVWRHTLGTVFSARSMTKIRRLERGYRYAIAQLVEAGATPPSSDIMPPAELTAWMHGAMRQICRRVKHGGNHRYVWALDKSIRRQVAALALVDAEGAKVPYPKALDLEAA